MFHEKERDPKRHLFFCSKINSNDSNKYETTTGSMTFHSYERVFVETPETMQSEQSGETRKQMIHSD